MYLLTNEYFIISIKKMELILKSLIPYELGHILSINFHSIKNYIERYRRKIINVHLR